MFFNKTFTTGTNLQNIPKTIFLFRRRIKSQLFLYIINLTICHSYEHSLFRF